MTTKLLLDLDGEQLARACKQLATSIARSEEVIAYSIERDLPPHHQAVERRDALQPLLDALNNAAPCLGSYEPVQGEVELPSTSSNARLIYSDRARTLSLDETQGGLISEVFDLDVGQRLCEWRKA